VYQAHLSTERLQSIHDETSTSPAELQHLVSCSSCQELLDDVRWTQLLARMRPGEPAEGAHPDGDELLAYQTGALTGSRQAQLRRHLRGCRPCMVAYGRVREDWMHMGYPVPSAATLRRVIRRFRPRAMKRIGQLRIARLGGRLALEFLAAPGVNPGLCGTDQLPARRGRPGLQRCPAESELTVAYDRWSDALDDGSHRVAELAWGLRVSALPGTPCNALRVRLLPSHTVESAYGITIRLVPDGADESVAESDEDGVAVLACPKGRSRLIVEVEPPLLVDIQFDS
jgi:hypothetical protein